MKKVTLCRCCKGKKLLPYLKLGMQPLANSYHKNEKLKLYPLTVIICKKCFHSQLSIVVDPDDMFRNYLYVSGTTKTFQNHCKELAKDAVKRFKTKKLHVLDIACNDGTQLEYFRKLGCEVTGVDPAKNLRKITKQKNIPVVVDYWTRKISAKIKTKFNIITGTNVFAHVDDLDEFLFATKQVLQENGILILEFPYANNMIKENEFDTVYHEHLSYFLVHSFKTLVERLDFHIIDILRTQIHGGSIRFFVKNGKGKHSQKVNQLIRDEKRKGLLKEATYLSFAQRVKKNKQTIKRLLLKQKKSKKIIGYGASAKGNTMLNYFKISLDYIVDDNPLKWGYLTPGRNILIRAPQDIASEKDPLAVIVLSWNFYNEILKKIISYRGINKGDSCILYVPTVKEIPTKLKKFLHISA